MFKVENVILWRKYGVIDDYKKLNYDNYISSLIMSDYL